MAEPSEATIFPNQLTAKAQPGPTWYIPRDRVTSTPGEGSSAAQHQAFGPRQELRVRGPSVLRAGIMLSSPCWRASATPSAVAHHTPLSPGPRRPRRARRLVQGRRKSRPTCEHRSGSTAAVAPGVAHNRLSEYTSAGWRPMLPVAAQGHFSAQLRSAFNKELPRACSSKSGSGPTCLRHQHSRWMGGAFGVFCLLL